MEAPFLFLPNQLLFVSVPSYSREDSLGAASPDSFRVGVRNGATLDRGQGSAAALSPCLAGERGALAFREDGVL